MITRVKFPNESYHVEIKNFNYDNFKVLDSNPDAFKDVVFGYWMGTLISIPKEDYKMFIIERRDKKINKLFI